MVWDGACEGGGGQRRPHGEVWGRRSAETDRAVDGGGAEMPTPHEWWCAPLRALGRDWAAPGPRLQGGGRRGLPWRGGGRAREGVPRGDAGAAHTGRCGERASERACAGGEGESKKNNSLALTPSIARARSATRPCGGWPHAHPSQWPPLPAPRPGRRARPHPRPGRRLHRPRMRGRGVAANRAGRPRPAPRPGQVNEMRGCIPLILNWEAGVDATHAGASSRARRAPPCPATRCPIKPRNSKRAPFFFSCLPIHRPRLFRLPPPALPLPDRLHAGPVRCPGKGRGGAV